MKHDLVEFKVQCLKVFCYHSNNSTILLFIHFLEQLLKFLVNFTLLKYVKSQRSYNFLITKRAEFWLPNFGFKRSLLSLLKHSDLWPKAVVCPKIRSNRNVLLATPETTVGLSLSISRWKALQEQTIKVKNISTMLCCC